MQDTITFQKKGVFPENKDLTSSLNKMSSDIKTVIFEDKVKPIL